MTLMSDESRKFKTLRLIDGSVIEGDFTFHADGMIGAYPRFIRTDGLTVFFHSVAVASPLADPRPF